MSPYRTAIGPPFWSAATIVPPVEAHELGSVSLLRWDQCNFRFARDLTLQWQFPSWSNSTIQNSATILVYAQVQIPAVLRPLRHGLSGTFQCPRRLALRTPPFCRASFGVRENIQQKDRGMAVSRWRKKKEVHHPTKFDRTYRAHRNNQACRNRNVRFEGINPHGCHMYYTRSKHLYEYDLSTDFSEEMLIFSYSPWIKHGARDVIGNSIIICVRKGPMPCTVKE